MSRQGLLESVDAEVGVHLDSRHASTRLLAQSITATRERKPRRIGMYVI